MTLSSVYSIQEKAFCQENPSKDSSVSTTILTFLIFLKWRMSLDAICIRNASVVLWSMMCISINANHLLILLVQTIQSISR